MKFADILKEEDNKTIKRAKTLVKAFSKGEFTFDAPIFFGGDTQKWNVFYEIVKDINAFRYSNFEEMGDVYIDGFMSRKGSPVYKFNVHRVEEGTPVDMNYGVYGIYTEEATNKHLKRILSKFKIYIDYHS